MKINTITLPNNLRVVLVDTKAFPSITSILLVNAGSRFENEKNNGVAHFFEHMAFKGSKKYPDAFTLAAIVDGFGGEFNAFTSKDYTGYYIKAPTIHAETMVEVLADMIQTPKLQQEEIDREKGVIVQEIGMYEDTPQKKIYTLYENLLYGGTPLGMDILGTAKTVTSFDRSTFTSYMDSLYYPSNAVFVIAGGFADSGAGSMDALGEYVMTHFGDWKDGTLVPHSPVVDSQDKPQLLLSYKKSEQAHLCFGYRTFPESDDRKYALSVFAAVLGAGMSSRLFTEVREKRGLCYAVRTMTDHYSDVGNMLTYAGVSTDVAKVTEAIKVIKEQHEDVATKGITPEELSRAKELMKGRLLLSLEDTLNVAFMHGKELLHEGHMTEIDEHMAKIDALSAQDIKDVAKEVVDSQRTNLALIGPFKNQEPFESI
ncbi:insulinase family protein [Candidatus Woesebacteria bacterium]|nr:insulinase family protein [Candidatus Woesebacteria bacterium]